MAGCGNSCSSAGDEICDDGSAGNKFSACDLGEDCNDCGYRAVPPLPPIPPRPAAALALAATSTPNPAATQPAAAKPAALSPPSEP